MGAYELPSMFVLVTELCEGGCLLDCLELVETMNVRRFTLHMTYPVYSLCLAVHNET